MSGAASTIRHYGIDDLVERILGVLAAAGHDTSKPTVEMLNLVDQLHGGGLNSTKNQASLVPIDMNTRVLDAGCGVGGSSRYLAHTYGCRVEAFDLTPQFVQAAVRLNALCGLGARISAREASVTDLPYADQGFDLVWCQNVTMNVEDKPRMFAEAFRVLAPGGHYTITHAAQGPAGTPYYPLPWARDASYSYLETPEQILRWLTGAGFDVIENRREGGGAAAQLARPAGDLGSAVIMGPDLPERQANGARSVAEGRLVPMLILARRQG